MKFIDTHTHLYLPEFDADRDSSVERAINSGVEKMLMPERQTHEPQEGEDLQPISVIVGDAE